MHQHAKQMPRIRRRHTHWRLTARAREVYGGLGLAVLALLLYIGVAGGWGRL